jgi:hypothetical protein
VTPRRALPFVVLSIVLACPDIVSASGAHSLTRAVLSVTPQFPRVGDRWHLSVAIQSADSMLHPERKVRIVGEMTGHPMRPVEVELTRAAGETDYGGDVVFTMRGPWNVTLRLEDVNEVLLTTFDLEVGGLDASTGWSEMRTMYDLHRPVRPNLVPPIWVVVGTIVLTLAFEVAAVVIVRRRATAPPPASRPAPSAGSRPVSSPA